jgi:P27 family predicted phage terminase small subunit
MGRPAKELSKHELHGTKRQVQETSGFVGGRPKFPKHLSAPARKIYKRTVALLEARQVLTEGDEQLIAQYAEITARWIEAKEGLLGNLFVQIPLLDSNGQLHFVERPNPRLKICREAEQQLVQIASKLSLTVADRERGKKTLHDDSSDEIVPGSIADCFPEFLQPQKEVIPFVPLAPEGAEPDEES